jgi:hypothetical protein
MPTSSSDFTRPGLTCRRPVARGERGWISPRFAGLMVAWEQQEKELGE